LQIIMFNGDTFCQKPDTGFRTW